MNKKKKWLFIFILPLLIIGIFYIRFISLDLYTHAENGLIHGDHKYVGGHETYRDFYDYTGNRKFKVEKEIGKTDNSRFFGFKETVWKIEGYPIDEVVFVKGLMFEDVYKVKN